MVWPVEHRADQVEDGADQEQELLRTLGCYEAMLLNRLPEAERRDAHVDH